MAAITRLGNVGPARAYGAFGDKADSGGTPQTLTLDTATASWAVPSVTLTVGAVALTLDSATTRWVVPSFALTGGLLTGQSPRQSRSRYRYRVTDQTR